MPNIVSDIVLSHALVYYAPLSTAVPADSVAAGTAWGGAWVALGYTSEPTEVNYEFEERDIEVQQELAPVKRVKISENLTITTTLSELYLAGLQLGMEGTVTPTAAGSGVLGKEELTVGGVSTLTEREWGIEGKYIDEDGATFPIRVFIWKATGKIGTIKLDKTEESMYELELKALTDTGKTVGQKLFKISKILEPAT